MNNLSKNIVLSTAAAITLSACSSAIGPDGYTYDPWEPVNRKIFAFNDALDTSLLKPVATVYDTVVPDPVQTGVSNFFGNIQDMGAVINSLLQLEFDQAARITARVINNSVYGLGGIFDVGTALGNNKIRADFGGTLAHYGVESGPYVVLPFLGPSTVRDGAGLAVDKLAFSPIYYTDDGFSWSAAALNGINTRAKLLSVERSLEGVMTDKYTLIRDTWLQHRWAELNKGHRSEEQQEAIDAIFAEEQQ
ncbi:VacJ family lipoprotein [Cardiobacteriaceae bacterium TAE3-ERU3]|nr:VacJ family lipoprotein [Cardiobacteriaceae bacterium TAE3-ERU3]